MKQKSVNLSLSEDKIETLRRAFRDNDPLEDSLSQYPATSELIARITGRASSSVRRWGLDENAPLYPVLVKLYNGEKAPWVCNLGDLWKHRDAVLRYKSGPRSQSAS